MRLFVAAEIDEELRDEAARLIRQLDGSGARVSWVRPAAMHLTFRFLGEVPDDRLAVLREALTSPASSAAPFTIQFGPLGLFPGRGRPRVIKLAVDGVPAGLVDGLEQTVRALGFPAASRPQQAHLTLGRIKDGPVSRLLGRLDAAGPVAPGRQLVNRFVLFESELRSAGPRYHPRAVYPLGG